MRISVFIIIFCMLWVNIGCSKKSKPGNSSSSSSSSEETEKSKSRELNQARYDNYRIYYVNCDTDSHLKLLQELENKSDSFIFYGHARKINQKLTILVAAHQIAYFTDLLESNLINHEILSYNFQEKIDQQNKEIQPKTISAKKYDWDHYFHLETIYSWMEKISKKKDVTVIDIGNSYKGIPIKGIKIKTNSDNPTIFIESGIHAREWIAPATATYLINKLIHSKDDRIVKHKNNFNWIIFPVVNPDGYIYTFDGDRMWRKNRRSFGLCSGVDLNRNFPFHWNEIGASSDPCAYDYSGTEGASEDETKRIIDFIINNKESENIKSFISLHSYSQLLMFPYAFTSDKVANYDDLNRIGQKAVEEIKRVSGQEYKSGSLYETIYPSSGSSKDWAYAIANISLTYTYELRGPANSTNLFILPAKQIRNTGEEILASIMTIIEEGAEYFKN